MSTRITLDRHTLQAALSGDCTSMLRVTHAPPAIGVARLWRQGAHQSHCRAHITAVTATTVGQVRELLDMDNVREFGAPNITEFWRRFLIQHDRRWQQHDERWYAAASLQRILGDLKAWHDRRVWHVEFHLDREPDERYLAASAPADRTPYVNPDGTRRTNTGDQTDLARGYTRDPRLAVKTEPACVDDTTLAEYAEKAEARHVENLAQRINELRQGLQHVAIDADERDLRVIEKHFRRMLNRRAA